VQEVALIDVQVRLALPPTVILVGLTVSVTMGVGGGLTVRIVEELPLPPAPEHVSVYVSAPVAAGLTVWLPLSCSLPLQAPLAVQDVAPADDQLKVALLPRMMLAGLTVRFTVGAAGALTVRIVEALVLPPAPVQVRV
jgi:hypothetical protein